MKNSNENMFTEVVLKSLKKKPHTKAEELRHVLNTLENRISQMTHCTPEEALEILSLFDQADTGLAELQEQGMTPMSEQTQFATITAQFRKKMVLFVRRAGGTRALEAARQSRQPSPDRWWWYIDEILAAQRNQKMLRGSMTTGVVVVILVIVTVLYKNFFAPDPTIVASIGHQQSAENFLVAGNYEEALRKANEALTYTPDEPELFLLKGVSEEALGQPDEATSSFEAALKQIKNKDEFYTQRALLYLMTGQAERALADCDTALQINPDSAISYLHKGQAYELLGDYPQAVESYRLADETANRLGNAQLQAIARVNLSQVLQKVSIPTAPVSDSGE